MQNLSRVEDLYKEAERNNIEVFYGYFPSCKGLAAEGFIAIDFGLSEQQETVCLAHELGHCMTGSFYRMSDPDIDRRRAERKADKWAIKKLVPVRELKRALQHGYQMYEIAEQMGVTEEFLRKAWEYYEKTERIRHSG